MQKLIFLRIGLVLNLLEDASLLGPLRHNGAKIQIPKKNNAHNIYFFLVQITPGRKFINFYTAC